jgi:integrase
MLSNVASPPARWLGVVSRFERASVVVQGARLRLRFAHAKSSPFDSSRRFPNDFVAVKSGEVHLSYPSYYARLKIICRDAGIPWVGTHGLRHSTSELYLHHGATYDDVRKLFAHSSGAVTDRYIHDRGSRLERVAQVVRLFPKPAPESEVSPFGGKRKGSL